MKKFLALSLCLLMFLSVFAGCAKIKQGAYEKGAIIPIYFSSPVNTLDPMYAYLDDAGAKLLGMLYEGLFRVNSKGEIENALCKSYKTGTDRDGDFYMEITLNETHWSDGRSVTADDFVFAWKRIIEPSSNSEAAAMLYEIKNARACKLGDASIDDFGAVAMEPQVLTITFENKIDIEIFKQYLASPALVPLREDKVSRLPDWASFYATTATNGPFYPKIFVPGKTPTAPEDDETTKSMILERSIYYYRDLDSEIQKLDAYVSPYRFKIYFCSPEEALAKYEAGELVYMSDLPLSARADYSKKVTKNETLSTATFYLNTAKAPFDDANVRKALSVALDRNEITDLVTFAVPAEGAVPSKVFNTKKGTSFRKEGGPLISAEGNLEEAKKLLAGADLGTKEFSLKIRDDETSMAVAEYAADVWGKLGFTVNIEVLDVEYHSDLDYDQFADLFSRAYYAKDFDVMLVDMLASSTDAFSTLAPFAVPYSGGAIDLSSGDYSAKPGVTGYSNSSYDAKIDEAFASQDRAVRAAALHEAESILMDDMPIIPLFVYQDAFVCSKAFTDFSRDYYTAPDFKEAELDDYKSYQEYKDVYDPEETTLPEVSASVPETTAANKDETEVPESDTALPETEVPAEDSEQA